RARAAAVPGGQRPLLLRPPGADQHRAAVGAACRAAPLLQHDRVRPDDRRDVLPPVPAGNRDGAAAMLLRMAQPQPRVARLAALAGALLLAAALPGACTRQPIAEDTS